jgi:hypothetical protein
METITTVFARHDLEVPAHLVADVEIPVCSGLQRQGDIIVVPTRAGKEKGAPIPTDGVAVVRGENGGNTHLLVGDGTWAPSRDLLTLGTLTVPRGGVAYLLHPEHGGQGIAPGSYRINRQREQADEIRRVAD